MQPGLFLCSSKFFSRKSAGSLAFQKFDRIKTRKGKSDACKLLEQAQDECRLLISDIHQDYANVEPVQEA